MAANTFYVVAANAGSWPLAGDMGVAFNEKVPDTFAITFTAKDNNPFIFTSSVGTFRQPDGTLEQSLTIQGAGKWGKFMFNADENVWEIPEHNLGAVSGGQKGDPGVAATLELGTVQEVDYSQPWEITMSGTPTNRVLNIKMRGPAPAPAGTGGTGGAALPTGGNVGQNLTITAVAADGTRSYGWSTPAAGTGGSGTVNDTEVSISPDANGVLTLDATVGMHFRCVLNRNVEIADPVNYTGAQRPTLVLVQGDTGGPFVVTKYGRKLMFEDAQPFVLATAAKAENYLTFRRTGDGFFIVQGSPDKTKTAGYGPVTPIARIATATYYSLADVFNALADGGTAYITRNGKGSESTATLAKPGNYTLAGQALADGSKPTLSVMTDTRLSFQKAIVNVENFNGQCNLTMRDVDVFGSRNADGTSRGIAVNGGAGLKLYNVGVRGCENGLLWTGDSIVELYDTLFDNNGQAGIPSVQGYTHNIYAGESLVQWKAVRCTFKQSLYGHNIKSRGYCYLRQVYTEGASVARELDCPNGGGIDAEDSWFNKYYGSAGQNELVAIGREGVITTRARSYYFGWCRFTNPIDGAGRDATFVSNYDSQKVTLRNPLFEGAVALANNSTVDGFATVNGVRGNVEIIYDPGATLGPRVTPGRPGTVVMTPPVN